MPPKKNPVADIVAEENVVSSPLRRSSRISIGGPAGITARRASASQEPTTPKVTKTRRASVTQEKTEKDESKPAPRGRRASLLQEEPVTDSPKKTRGRRPSLASSESSEIIETKKPATRRRSVAVEEEETAPVKARGRRASVAKEDSEATKEAAKPRGRRVSVASENAEEDKTATPSTRRRRSVVLDEPKAETLPKPVRGRRSSATNLEEPKEELKKVTTRGRRSSVTKEAEEELKKPVRTRRGSLEESEEKKSRGRRSSVDEHEDEPETKSTAKTPVKSRRRLSVNENAPNLDPIEEKESPNSTMKLTPIKKKKVEPSKPDMDLSIINESDDLDITPSKKGKTPVESPRKSPRLNKSREGSKTPDSLINKLNISLKRLSPHLPSNLAKSARLSFEKKSPKDEERKKDIPSSITEGSDGSFNFNLNVSIPTSTSENLSQEVEEGVADLNSSKGSSNSDKENMNVSTKNVDKREKLSALTDLNYNESVQTEKQNDIIVARVSTPQKQFVAEPMETEDFPENTSVLGLLGKSQNQFNLDVTNLDGISPAKSTPKMSRRSKSISPDDNLKSSTRKSLEKSVMQEEDKEVGPQKGESNEESTDNHEIISEYDFDIPTDNEDELLNDTPIDPSENNPTNIVSDDDISFNLALDHSRSMNASRKSLNASRKSLNASRKSLNSSKALKNEENKRKSFENKNETDVEIQDRDATEAQEETKHSEENIESETLTQRKSLRKSTSPKEIQNNSSRNRGKISPNKTTQSEEIEEIPEEPIVNKRISLNKSEQISGYMLEEFINEDGLLETSTKRRSLDKSMNKSKTNQEYDTTVDLNNSSKEIIHKKNPSEIQESVSSPRKSINKTTVEHRDSIEVIEDNTKRNSVNLSVNNSFNEEDSGDESVIYMQRMNFNRTETDNNITDEKVTPSKRKSLMKSVESTNKSLSSEQSLDEEERQTRKDHSLKRNILNRSRLSETSDQDDSKENIEENIIEENIPKRASLNESPVKNLENVQRERLNYVAKESPDRRESLRRRSNTYVVHDKDKLTDRKSLSNTYLIDDNNKTRKSLKNNISKDINNADDVNEEMQTEDHSSNRKSLRKSVNNEVEPMSDDEVDTNDKEVSFKDLSYKRKSLKKSEKVKPMMEDKEIEFTDNEDSFEDLSSSRKSLRKSVDKKDTTGDIVEGKEISESTDDDDEYYENSKSSKHKSIINSLNKASDGKIKSNKSSKQTSLINIADKEKVIDKEIVENISVTVDESDELSKNKNTRKSVGKDESAIDTYLNTKSPNKKRPSFTFLISPDKVKVLVENKSNKSTGNENDFVEDTIVKESVKRKSLKKSLEANKDAERIVDEHETECDKDIVKDEQIKDSLKRKSLRKSINNEEEGNKTNNSSLGRKRLRKSLNNEEMANEKNKDISAKRKSLAENKPASEHALEDSFVDEVNEENLTSSKIPTPRKSINKSKTAEEIISKASSPCKSVNKSKTEESDRETSQLKNSGRRSGKFEELEEIANKQLDDFLSSRLDQFEDEESIDEVSTSEKEESDVSDGEVEEDGFIDTMAMEGEEDTPSEGSNDIIEDGESLHSSESDEADTDEDYDSNDSFICDDEHENELLSGDEYDLNDEKKKPKSRIIEISDSEGDIIRIPKKEKKVKEKPKKSRIIKVCDDDVDENEFIDKSKLQNKASNDSVIIIDVDEGEEEIGKLEEKVKEKYHSPVKKNSLVNSPNSGSSNFTPLQKRRSSSITIQENIKVDEIMDAGLGEKINMVVQSFYNTVKKGEISLNLSIEYDASAQREPENIEETELNSPLNNNSYKAESGIEKLNVSKSDICSELNDSVFSSTKKSEDTDSVFSSIEKIGKEKTLRLSLSVDNISELDLEPEVSLKNRKRLSKSLEIIKVPKKKKKKDNKKIDPFKNAKRNIDKHVAQKKYNKTDLHKQTFGLMNQLINEDLANRPKRLLKPSESLCDMDSSWICEAAVIKPSSSMVTKREKTESKTSFHPKDFRNQMLYDPSRVKRVDTKSLMKKKGVF